MKIKEKSDMNFRMLQFQAQKTIHIIVSTFRQSGSLLNKMEVNQNAKCSMKRSWVNIFENPIATLHKGPWFKVSSSKFVLFSIRMMNV
jgi:hypothetical protein